MEAVSGEKILTRTEPRNLEAEKSVLGCMVLDRDALETAMGMLTSEDFYSRRNGMVFDAVIKAYRSLESVNPDSGSFVDPTTIQEQLAKAGAPPDLQDMSFLLELFKNDPISVNIKSYAQIVKDKSVERRLIRACGDISTMCYEDSEETEEILSKAETSIFDVLKSGISRDYIPINEVALEVFRNVEEASRNKNHITGVPTGFTDLDEMTTGLQPSDLIIIGARPSMGKTAFVLNILEHVAVKKNRPCMIFSLEMSRQQLVNRMFSMDSGINAQSLRHGDLADDDWVRLADSLSRIGSSNIIIDDTPGISVTELRSKCRKVSLEKRGLDLVIIDYLQLMSSSGRKNENRQNEVAEISRSLKALARDLNCPVIALSQLSRACETRPGSDKRPMLSDIRDSGSIEQDADVIMFLYRDDYYNPDTERKGEAEVIIAKQRNGPIGTVKLYWQAQTTRFVNMEKNFSCGS